MSGINNTNNMQNMYKNVNNSAFHPGGGGGLGAGYYYQQEQEKKKEKPQDETNPNIQNQPLDRLTIQLINPEDIIKEQEKRKKKEEKDAQEKQDEEDLELFAAKK